MRSPAPSEALLCERACVGRPGKACGAARTHDRRGGDTSGGNSLRDERCGSAGHCADRGATHGWAHSARDECVRCTRGEEENDGKAHRDFLLSEAFNRI